MLNIFVECKMQTNSWNVFEIFGRIEFWDFQCSRYSNVSMYKMWFAREIYFRFKSYDLLALGMVQNIVNTKLEWTKIFESSMLNHTSYAYTFELKTCYFFKMFIRINYKNGNSLILISCFFLWYTIYIINHNSFVSVKNNYWSLEPKKSNSIQLHTKKSNRLHLTQTTSSQIAFYFFGTKCVAKKNMWAVVAIWINSIILLIKFFVSEKHGKN